MPTLVLTLPLASATVPEYDFVQSGDGVAVQALGHAAAALLPDARGAEVVALLPARALSWHRINLPDKLLRGLLAGRVEAARARSVLSGVLEDQLLDEPERLHFAIFPAEVLDGDTAGAAWVAVCDRAWLHAGLQALESAGLRATRIVAEATPTPPGMALALVGTAMAPAQLLLCTPAGVSALPLLPATLALAQASPGLEVMAEPGVMELAQQHFGNQVTLHAPAQRLLAAARSPWNLAQLELSASTGGRLLKRLAAHWQQFRQEPAWRPARWGLAALLLVQVLALNAMAWQERRRLDGQRAAIDAMLQQTFPDQRLVIDAPAQMQRGVDELARSRGVAADLSLARVFAILGPQAPTGLQFTSIEMNGRQLRLGASGLDAARAQPLLAALGARGLHAELQGDQLTITAREAR